MGVSGGGWEGRTGGGGDRHPGGKGGTRPLYYRRDDEAGDAGSPKGKQRDKSGTGEELEEAGLEASHGAEEMRSAVRRFWPSPEDSGWPGSF